MKLRTIVVSLLTMLVLAAGSLAQDRTTGTVKGKVGVVTGTPYGVMVLIKQGEREVIRGETDKNGSFQLRVPPGIYSLTFKKPGLSVGTIENVEVKSGKTRSLGDRLILTIDEGSIAFIRGSVFSREGRIAPGVPIELAKIQEDGSLKKIDGRISNETGSFVFRLAPDNAKYRLTAKFKGLDPVSRELEVNGAAIYRIALSQPAQK
jgi:hypothetical protein